MNYRECPNCHYKYSIKEYSKKLLYKSIWQSWKCEKCGMLIKFDHKRRIIGSLILAATLFGVFQLRDFFDSRLVYFLVAITIMVIEYFIIILFDKFRMAKK